MRRFLDWVNWGGRPILNVCNTVLWAGLLHWIKKEKVSWAPTFFSLCSLTDSTTWPTTSWPATTPHIRHNRLCSQTVGQNESVLLRCLCPIYCQSTSVVPLENRLKEKLLRPPTVSQVSRSSENSGHFDLGLGGLQDYEKWIALCKSPTYVTLLYQRACTGGLAEWAVAVPVPNIGHMSGQKAYCFLLETILSVPMCICLCVYTCSCMYIGACGKQRLMSGHFLKSFPFTFWDTSLILNLEHPVSVSPALGCTYTSHIRSSFLTWVLELEFMSSCLHRKLKGF